MDYIIEELSNKNADDWKRLSEECKEGSFFHTLKWKQILEQSFNYKSHNFLLYRNGEPVALCPLYEDTIQGIRGLVSLPLSDYNHLLITDKNDSLIPYHILNKCKEITKINKLFYIIITNSNELIRDHFDKYKPFPHPITGNMVLNLEELNPDKIWNEVFSTNYRKYVRRFEKDGFKIKEVRLLEDVKAFYEFYKINIESINSTPYPFSHFEDLLKTYSSTEMMITLLKKDDHVYGGHLVFLHEPNKTMYSRYISLNRNLPSRYKPGLYIYWDMINTAFKKGYKVVDFGQTPPYPNNVYYKLKEKFGTHYKKEYSSVFPRSFIFKLGYIIYYNIYTQAKKYKYR